MSSFFIPSTACLALVARAVSSSFITSSMPPGTICGPPHCIRGEEAGLLVALLQQG